MTSFGLVGYGKWGKILSKSISLVGNLVFISNTKKTYKNNKKIDWCLIATNDVSHYKIVKYSRFLTPPIIFIVLCFNASIPNFINKLMRRGNPHISPF